MTDLEQFAEFFKGKGVPFRENVASEDDLDDETVGLAICDAILKFNDASEFIGIFNYESGYFHERIPASEH